MIKYLGKERLTLTELWENENCQQSTFSVAIKEGIVIYSIRVLPFILDIELQSLFCLMPTSTPF